MGLSITLIPNFGHEIRRIKSRMTAIMQLNTSCKLEAQAVCPTLAFEATSENIVIIQFRQIASSLS